MVVIFFPSTNRVDVANHFVARSQLLPTIVGLYFESVTGSAVV